MRHRCGLRVRCPVATTCRPGLGLWNRFLMARSTSRRQSVATASTHHDKGEVVQPLQRPPPPPRNPTPHDPAQPSPTSEDRQTGMREGRSGCPVSYFRLCLCCSEHTRTRRAAWPTLLAFTLWRALVHASCCSAATTSINRLTPACSRGPTTSVRRQCRIQELLGIKPRRKQDKRGIGKLTQTNSAFSAFSGTASTNDTGSQTFGTARSVWNCIFTSYPGPRRPFG